MIAKLLIKVAIIDAFFCQGVKPPHEVIIHPAKDFTKEKAPYEKTCTQDRKFHGHQVLTTFLKNLESTNYIEITPYKVFLKNGEQDNAALAESLKDIKKQGMDLAIMAIGFLKLDGLPSELPTLTFASNGASGNGVRNDSKLWPQELTSENLILISHYFPSVTSGKLTQKGHFDPSSLYLNKTNYFVKNPPHEQEFNGSSYAVSVAAAKVTSFCFPLKNLKKCLADSTRPLTILSTPSDKNYRTFSF